MWYNLLKHYIKAISELELVQSDGAEDINILRAQGKNRLCNSPRARIPLSTVLQEFQALSAYLCSCQF